MTDLRTAAQQALAHVQEFKRRWMAVPPFGNKVNKATREAVTLAHVPVLQLEESLRAALEQPEQKPVADRAAFERHAKSLGYSVHPDTREGREGGYWSSHKHFMWETWQAALEQPERATVKDSLTTGGPPKFEAVPYPEVQPYPFEMPPLTPEQLARVSAGMRTLKLTMVEVEQPEQEPVAWSDARLRGIASDYFQDAKDWPAAMLCLRHLLMEQAKYPPASAPTQRRLSAVNRELLEALKGMFDQLDLDGCIIPAVLKARAAIAKAEGEV
jgi:hypothetical protein